jgi:hypothetical protein
LDFIALNFNEGIDQEVCLQVKCLVTNATSYDVLIGQEALFPLGFTINNWFEHAYYRVDWETNCRNHSLRLATKGRACKSAGQEGSPRVTFHAPESAKECEGMNPHTPKGTPTL